MTCSVCKADLALPRTEACCYCGEPCTPSPAKGGTVISTNSPYTFELPMWLKKLDERGLA